MENFYGAIVTLKIAGVRFVHEATRSTSCRMAVIADPDGNPIVIHERHAA